MINEERGTSSFFLQFKSLIFNPFSNKAELWSLFTAILRKSQLNLQACVEIGLIETALHELNDADDICAG